MGEQRLTFGFEGIWQGTAVLYDHQTNSLWMHVTGACFEGHHAGVVLERLPTGRHTTWRDWHALYPDTQVLARDPRWMGQPGDRGYFPAEAARGGSAFLPETFARTIQARDARFEPHDLVYGVVVAGHARAYPFARLARAPLVEETLEGVPATVWFDAASRSAAAFDRRLGADTLAFVRRADGSVHDEATGSRWTMDGLCVDGRLRGRRLTPLRGLMAEWYGWFANHPATSVWAGA